MLVHLADGHVIQRVQAASGAFAIGGLPAGGYTLQAFPTANLPYWKSERLPVNIQQATDELTANLTLRDADLWGYTHDLDGDPVTGARVIAAQTGRDRQADWSNADGFWSIGGLEDGDVILTALPPWSRSGLLTPAPLEITLPGAANPYTLVLSTAPKIVVGSVDTNTGQPVFHARVIARSVTHPGQVEALTDAQGQYRLNLSTGLWALSVRREPDSSPADWVYPDPPAFVYFQFNTQPEERQQDFTVLMADAAVIGEIQMPDGSAPPFSVTVALRNDEGIGRRDETTVGDGAFEIAVPNGGYKVVIHPSDDGYLGPAIDPITVEPGATVDLGVMTLLARDAAISGVVRSGGSGVEGIPVVAWRPGIPGSLHTTSGPDGQYSLAVAAGDWRIQPAPLHDQPYLYDGAGELVTLAAGELAENVDFDLLAADAVIVGTLVKENGELASDASGWATAYQAGAPQIHNGAPIENGLFSIHVPAGVYRVAALLPAGSPYTSSVEPQVTVGAGATVEVSLTVQQKSATIFGSLWDARNEDIVQGVDGVVGAWSGNNWVMAPIDAGTGLYRLGVSAGIWRVNFRIDPQANYARVSLPVNVALQNHQTAIVPLRVLEKDGAISGTVLAPDGSPVAGAKVIAHGVGPQLDGLWLKTTSAADGSFNLPVPAGLYRLGAVYNHPGWLQPGERLVNVPPGGASSGHRLQFRAPDATLSGILTDNNATEAGEAYVWAWTPEGAFNYGRFPLALNGGVASGPYELGVLTHSTWRLGAVFETNSQFWIGRTKVVVEGGDVVQDLVLEGPYLKPAPVVVTFDAAEPQYIRLADGTYIFIPAGAMPVDGQVTLRIVPLASLPHQRHAHLIRYGYAFLATDENGEPIEEHFNQDVVITFTYTDAELIAAHLVEAALKPAYYSTTTERWTFPDAYVIDPAANRVTMQIDHFTDYALTGEASQTIYLPMTFR